MTISINASAERPARTSGDILMLLVSLALRRRGVEQKVRVVALREESPDRRLRLGE